MFAGINKFDLQSSSATKMESIVVGVSFSFQYITGFIQKFFIL